jgi:hypothetical protein
VVLIHTYAGSAKHKARVEKLGERVSENQAQMMDFSPRRSSPEAAGGKFFLIGSRRKKTCLGRSTCDFGEIRRYVMTGNFK